MCLSISLRFFLAYSFSDTVKYNILLSTVFQLPVDENELNWTTPAYILKKMSWAMEDSRGETNVILAQCWAMNGELLIPCHSKTVSTLRHAALAAYTQPYIIHAACLLQTCALMQILLTEPSCASCWQSLQKKNPLKLIHHSNFVKKFLDRL